MKWYHLFLDRMLIPIWATLLVVGAFAVTELVKKIVSPKCQESESKVTTLEGKKGKEFRKR